MLRMMAFALAAMQLLSMAARAEGPKERPANGLVALTWRSSPGNEEGLASELERLYLILYNTGSLAVRTVENPDGLFIERLLREQGVFDGSFFPQGLDNLLCDLNPDICTRSQVPVAETALADVTSHVGGYQLSKAIWVFRSPSVVVPDYRLERFTTLRPTAVRRSWTPDAYKPASGEDCTAWGADCATLVRALNPALPSSLQQQERMAILPITGIATTIHFKVEQAGKYADLLGAIGRDQQEKGIDPKAVSLWSNDQSFAPVWREILAKDPPASRAIDAVQQHLPTMGSGMAFGAMDEPLFSQQEALFKLIHHPFGDHQDLGELFDEPVTVMVLDEKPEPSHCEFGIAAAVPDPCDQIVPAPPNPKPDHATHVQGIINAPINGHGMVGINPKATVVFRPVNTSFLGPDDTTNLAQMLFAGILEKNVRVANMSWGFKERIGGPSLKLALGSLSQNVLVVVAAGNEGSDLGDTRCIYLPACLFTLDNVITVVGLNLNAQSPALWASNPTNGSNWNPGFHIGAIAESVLSTIGHDKLSRLSGTSQAAPQVAATASLIYAAAAHVYGLTESGALPPLVVKNRLIYTADIFSSLKNKLMSGRLNVERAIDIVDTQVVVLRDGKPTAVSGTIIGSPPADILCRKEDGPDAYHPWGSIRRMVLDPDSNRMLLFKNAGGSNRNSALLRVDGCNLNSLSQEVTLRTRDPANGGGFAEFKFKLGEIIDYTSPLLAEQ